MGELKTIVERIEAGMLKVPQEVREILGHDTRLVVGTACSPRVFSSHFLRGHLEKSQVNTG